MDKDTFDSCLVALQRNQSPLYKHNDRLLAENVLSKLEDEQNFNKNKKKRCKNYSN